MGFRAAGGLDAIKDGRHLSAILDFTEN